MAHLLAAKGNEKLLTELFKTRNLEVSTVDQQGDSPLHKAAQNGHLSVVKQLVLCKADVNHQNKKGFTALHEAAEKGSVNIVRYIPFFPVQISKIMFFSSIIVSCCVTLNGLKPFNCFKPLI